MGTPHYTQEQKEAFVLKFRNFMDKGLSIKEAASKAGGTPASYYRWSKASAEKSNAAPPKIVVHENTTPVKRGRPKKRAMADLQTDPTCYILITKASQIKNILESL